MAGVPTVNFFPWIPSVVLSLYFSVLVSFCLGCPPPARLNLFFLCFLKSFSCSLFVLFPYYLTCFDCLGLWLCLYCTTHNTNIHAPVGFEPAIPARERPQTIVLDHSVFVLGTSWIRVRRVASWANLLVVVLIASTLLLSVRPNQFYVVIMPAQIFLKSKICLKILGVRRVT